MRENILIVLLVLIVADMCLQAFLQAPKNRYEVVASQNMLTILVDKQTGETWRNCICGEKSNIPGCWEKMVTINSESFNKPIGEVKATKKMEKLLKKQQPVQQPQN